MWDGLLTVLAVLLESVTYWYPPTIVLLWCLCKFRPTSREVAVRVLFAANTLLLIQSIVWSISFLAAWLVSALLAVSDGREASAYLSDFGTQFIITSVVSFFIGLLPLVLLRSSRRYRFLFPFLLLGTGLLWRGVLDLIEEGRINLSLRTNLESLIMFLFVFATLLFITFLLTRKRTAEYIFTPLPNDH